MLRLKVGVSRKEATDRDGSVGATCEIEVEIPGGSADQEVLRIRDHWLDFCETTVDEELERLRGGHLAAESRPTTTPAPAARPKSLPPARVTREDYDAPNGGRRRRDPDDDRGAEDDRVAPVDGRQLLGWAAKQDPDAKGLVISFGKQRGYPPKIVDWDDEQVRAAYRFARSRQGRSR